MSEQLTRGEIQDQFTKLSKSDSNYRAKLLKDPKAVLEAQMGTRLSANVTVEAVEETPNTMYVVVPYVGKTGGELSDGALRSVSGGISAPHVVGGGGPGGGASKIESHE